jgi:hypothetical protein
MHSRGSLIRFRLSSPPGRAGQGRSLRSRRHGDGASATLDSPALPGGFRQLSDEAPLRLGQVAGRSRRHARSAETSYKPFLRGHPVGQFITSGPARQAEHCQGRVDTKTPAAAGGERREYAAFVRRIQRAYSRRVGDGDVEALVLMLGLAEEIDTAIAEVVKSLRSYGYSWAEIGSRLGITRQAAQQRWGQLDPATRPDRLTTACPLTCARAGPKLSAHVLLGSSSDRAIF